MSSELHKYIEKSLEKKQTNLFNAEVIKFPNDKNINETEDSKIKAHYRKTAGESQLLLSLPRRRVGSLLLDVGCPWIVAAAAGREQFRRNPRSAVSGFALFCSFWPILEWGVATAFGSLCSQFCETTRVQ